MGETFKSLKKLEVEFMRQQLPQSFGSLTVGPSRVPREGLIGILKVLSNVFLLHSREKEIIR